MITDELLTPEFIERLKVRDDRYRSLDLRFQIERELRDSMALKIVLEAAGEQSAEALEQLAKIDPTDQRGIINLQARVQRARFIARTLNNVIQRGEVAEASLNEEQQIEIDEHVTMPIEEGT